MRLVEKHQRFFNRTKVIFFLVLIIIISLPSLFDRYTSGVVDWSLAGFFILILAAFLMFVLPAWFLSILEVIKFEQANRFDKTIVKQSLAPTLLYIFGFIVLYIIFRYGVSALFSLLLGNSNYGLLLITTYLYHVLIIYVFVEFRN